MAHMSCIHLKRSVKRGGRAWIGGRIVQPLLASGLAREAYRELIPMLGRIIRNDGFYEWYTLGNQP